jgi:hypothetical protein
MRLTTVGRIATLTLAILVAPRAAKAQPPAHSPKVGWLEGSGRTDKEHLYTVFLQGLRELGYVEGQNLILVRRDAEGQLDRLPALAAELVRLQVDVIVTAGGFLATPAAMQATTTIIVMSACGVLCGQNPQGCQAGRSPRGAAHKIRASPQPQDRQGAGAYDTSVSPDPGGRGDPIKALALIASSPSHCKMFRRAPVFVDKLLKGTTTSSWT